MTASSLPSWFVLRLSFDDDPKPSPVSGFVRFEGGDTCSDRYEVVQNIVHKFAIESERALRGPDFNGKLIWRQEEYAQPCLPQPQLEKVTPDHEENGVTLWLVRPRVFEG